MKSGGVFIQCSFMELLFSSFILSPLTVSNEVINAFLGILLNAQLYPRTVGGDGAYPHPWE